MKRATKLLLITLLAAATGLPANAQLFSRESLGGAVVGGIAGGIIGHNSGRRTAEGIGIGAGAGLLLGSLTSRYRSDYHGHGPYHGGSGPYAHGYSSRPNYALTGAVLGGVAGGVIGHNQGGHTAEGIAIGAGAGLLLGGIAEHELRKRERLTPGVAYVAPVEVVSSGPVIVSRVETAPRTEYRPVTIINHYHGSSQASSMSGANALFGR